MDIQQLGDARISERVHGAVKQQTIDGIVKRLQDWRRPYVQMLGDDVPGPTDLYNAAGAIYPLVDGTQQRRLTAASLSSMDRIRYDMVQDNHTRFLAEPLLLADIASQRHVYWPGLDDAKRYVAEHGTFAAFEHKHVKDGLLDTPYSDFCIAYGLMRSDICDWGSRMTKSLQPSFIARVVEGAVRIRGGAHGHTRLRELLPKETYKLLEHQYSQV